MAQEKVASEPFSAAFSGQWDCDPTLGLRQRLRWSLPHPNLVLGVPFNLRNGKHRQGCLTASWLSSPSPSCHTLRSQRTSCLFFYCSSMPSLLSAAMELPKYHRRRAIFSMLQESQSTAFQAKLFI